MFSSEYMRFSKVTEDLLGTETGVRLLRTFLERPQRSFTGREIAGESGTPVARTIERLRVLEKYGLVQSKDAGRAKVWSWVPSHALEPGLRAWFEYEGSLRNNLVETLRSKLSEISEIRRAVLFGSVARGDERAESDIDILIIVSSIRDKTVAQAKVDPIADAIRATFTNPLRALIYTEEETRGKGARPLMGVVEKEGITLVDKSPLRVERVEHAKSAIYLRKADEFGAAMAQAAAAKNWNAVGLNAIHAVISATDALTSFHLGKRSRSQDHEDVILLLRELPLQDVSAKASQALEVLRLKNKVEYEARLFEEEEAHVVQLRAERFLAWAHASLRRAPKKA